MPLRVAFHLTNLWKGCTVYNHLNYTWYISYLHILLYIWEIMKNVVYMILINQMPKIVTLYHSQSSCMSLMAEVYTNQEYQYHSLVNFAFPEIGIKWYNKKKRSKSNYYTHVLLQKNIFTYYNSLCTIPIAPLNIFTATWNWKAIFSSLIPLFWTSDNRW